MWKQPYVRKPQLYHDNGGQVEISQLCYESMETLSLKDF